MIGPYRVVALAGAGGMGEVWRARDDRLQRDVALKILRDGASDEGARRRLLAEARSLSALQHPHIVAVHDLISRGEDDLLVMEYVEGEALSARLSRAGMPVREALTLAIPIADALAAAHAAGVVHRDIKPANVLVTRAGTAKVVDFGLAGRSAPRQADVATLVESSPTNDDNKLSGTPMYMSPEQARGEHSDARSDIFSFGVLLHELLTGTRAFQRRSLPETLTAVLHDEPAMLEWPAPLTRLLKRCLRKEPGRRLQSMADVKLELVDILDELQQGMPPVTAGAGPRRRIALPVFLVSAAMVGGAAAVWMVGFGPGTATWQVLPLTTFQGLEQLPRLSPSGEQVAFMWNGASASNHDIYVQHVSGAAPPLRLTTDLAMDGSPTWSPDGQQVGFLRGAGGGTDVMIVSALGGAERRAARVPGWTAWTTSAFVPVIDWSPNGRFIVLGTPSLAVLDVRSGEVISYPVTPAPGSDRHPAVSPDGRSIAYVRGEGVYTQLWRRSVDDEGRPAGTPQLLTDEFRMFVGVTWKDDATVITAAGWLGSTMQLFEVGPDRELRPLPVESIAAQYPDYAVGKNRLAYQRRILDTDVFRVPLSPDVAPQSSPIIASTYQDREAQYSPDGTRIAYISTRSGQPAVWRSDSDGGNQVLIGSVDQGVPGSPRWTPDGQHVLFDASVPGTGSDIFMVPAEGGTPKPVVGGSAHEILGVMSHDNRWLYYLKDGEIWKLAPNGGAPVIVVRARAARLLPSDDGLWLYFSRGNDVWRVPTKGGGESLVKVGVNPASWTLRGSVLYELRGVSGIASTNGDDVTLTAYDTTTRATRELYRFPTPIRFFAAKALDISPDGRWALVSQVTRDESDLVVVDGIKVR